MNSTRDSLDKSADQNRMTKETIVKLPKGPGKSDALEALNAAEAQALAAQAQIQEATELLYVAIDANTNAAEAVMSLCPGQPVEVKDPTSPGQMILQCASTVPLSE